MELNRPILTNGYLIKNLDIINTDLIRPSTDLMRPFVDLIRSFAAVECISESSARTLP